MPGKPRRARANRGAYLLQTNINKYSGGSEMARTVRDSKLESRAARNRLEPGKTPHFKTLVPGKLHLGYRRKHKDKPGQWIVRHYLGAERYHTAPLGLADDFQD